MKVQKLAITIITVMISAVLFMAAAAFEGDVTQERTATLTGTVVDADMQEGVEGAEVTLAETDQTATTDEFGTFSFSDLEEGTYTITVSAEGYSNAEEEVEVTEHGATVEIQLYPEQF
jgi:type 1 fimbria pilin